MKPLAGVRAVAMAVSSLTILHATTRRGAGLSGNHSHDNSCGTCSG